MHELHAPTRVLVVDDEPVIRTFATRVLTDVGYTVDAVAGGSDALKRVEDDGPFDLFVIDVVMPGMRGDELARRLRARDPDVKILYVTGYVDSLFDAKNVLWENEFFLEKPVTVAGFCEAVSLALHGPSVGRGKPAIVRRRPVSDATSSSDEVCEACGNLLLAPHLAPGMRIPVAADLICLNCGCAYTWTGDPARLRAVPRIATDSDDDDAA